MSTPFGITSYVPPKKRSPVQRAASETAIRACRRLKTRRAPIARAIVFGIQPDEYAWKVPTTGAPASNVHASQPTIGAIGSCTWITSKLARAQLAAQAHDARRA